jgi:hypothetical protein
MEGLAPPFELCLELELKIEMGESVRSALISLIAGANSEFSFLVQELLICSDQRRSPEEIFGRAKSCYQRALLQMMNRGLKGEPILAGLRTLKAEMEIASTLELETFLSRLPLQALIPLLIFLLPSFMILLFGPVLSLLANGVFQ